MSRYTQLIQIARELNPRVILEVGTWRGDRALGMLHACPKARYVGFDLFGAATDETDKVEFNVKAHYPVQAIAAKLADFDAELIVGNTRQTLPEYVKGKEPFVDLAFIDGGHSVETIRSDWGNVEKIMLLGSLVVFDDFYSNLPVERINIVGCNRVLEALERPYKLLPAKDWVVGGGLVQMATIEL